jgi:toxin ParE1/3/4
MFSPERKLDVILTTEARDDLRDIALYGVLTRGEESAERYQEAIDRALDRLSSFPALGRLKEGLPGEVRSVGIGQHSILYRVEHGAIRILRVLHQRMDAARHLDL